MQGLGRLVTALPKGHFAYLGGFAIQGGFEFQFQFHFAALISSVLEIPRSSNCDGMAMSDIKLFFSKLTILIMEKDYVDQTLLLHKTKPDPHRKTDSSPTTLPCEISFRLSALTPTQHQ